ncbi:DUF1236 domain-containing protein [Methylobacterium oryzisoli]|uniref:DUF1236 domain-containing protein n=1 Tax=Methylobacterium oryzisoli TaxID=3385502 RepID=UPI0038922C12
MRIPFAMAISLIVSTTCVAQVASDPDPSKTGTLDVTLEQRTLIKQYAHQHRSNLILMKLLLPAGATVPEDVVLDPLPYTVVSRSPHLRDCGYFLSDTGTYIVDARSRRVVTSID